MAASGLIRENSLKLVYIGWRLKCSFLFDFYDFLEGADGGSDCAEELYSY
jgi:hypothetical protein